MKTKDITSVTMERLVGQYKMPHISHDVVLVDTLKTLPELTGARRLSLCMFMGVCTDGVASNHGQRQEADCKQEQCDADNRRVRCG